MLTNLEKIITQLLEGSEWRHTGDLEDGIKVGIVATTKQSDLPTELIITELPTLLLIVHIEESLGLFFVEDTAEFLECLGELLDVDSTPISLIKVPECFSGRLSLVFFCEGLLTNLFEYCYL